MAKRRPFPPCPEQQVLIELPPAKPQEPVGRQILIPVWTENKARLIERYLYYFVLVTKHGCYVDGFAGPQSAGTPDSWAAELVLNSRPLWLRHFHLCELKADSFRRLEKLRDTFTHEHPKSRRKITLYKGDFNEHLAAILEAIPQKEATFCLLDQRMFECHWASVMSLSKHRTEGHKVELFYFLATGWLGRSLAAQENTTVLDAWWGRSDWTQLEGLKHDEAAERFTVRFREELGYTSAKAWPIFQSAGGGRVMYYMIHASDHPEAHKLMRRAYDRAVTPRESLRQLRLQGLEALFADSADL